MESKPRVSPLWGSKVFLKMRIGPPFPHVHRRNSSINPCHSPFTTRMRIRRTLSVKLWISTAEQRTWTPTYFFLHFKNEHWHIFEIYLEVKQNYRELHIKFQEKWQWKRISKKDNKSWTLHKLGHVIVYVTSCLWRHYFFYSSIHSNESCHRYSLRYCEQFGCIFIKSHLMSKYPISTL